MRLITTGLLAFLLAATARPVRAQDDAAVPAVPVDPAMERVEPHVARAEALFEAGNFEAALAEFQRVYDELDGHPRRFETLYNMGLCHERLFRYGQALDLFQRYLDEGGERVQDRAEVEATMRALLGLLGTLRVRSNVPVEVWVDDVLIGRGPGELYVAGGRHTVELRADGYQSVQHEVKLTARGTADLDVTLSPVAAGDGGLHPALFWTSLGLTVAAAGVGAGFGIAASSASDDARARAGDEVERFRNTSSTRTDIQDQAKLANVMFAVSGVLALGSTLLLLMTDWDGERAPGAQAGEDAASLRPILQAAGSGAMLGVAGSF